MLPFDQYRITFIAPSVEPSTHLCQLLEFEGISVSVASPADLHHLREVPADLVILDQSRLRGTTLAVATQLSLSWRSHPLTLALVAPGDEVRGIELVERGLDAFIVTPCGPREFVARVRALLRRARTPEGAAWVGFDGNRPVRVSDLDIDPSRRRVRVGGRELRLTEHEFQLLYCLATSPGRVFDRQALLDAVWGGDTFVTARSVDALVKRLRQQLRSAGRVDGCVETVRGVGYRLMDARSQVDGVTAMRAS